MKRAILSLTALFLASTAFAHEVKVGDLQIIHAAIPAPAPTAQSAAGYMAISNEGKTADRLLGIEVDFAAKAMVHNTEFNADGVASMMHVPALDIPAEDTVVLEPGGYHIMLMGLNKPLHEGDMLPATLIFEKAGRVGMAFMVDPADGAVDHSKMDHSAMGHAAAPVTGDAASQIEDLLKAQFDKPDARLSVAPITVQGNVAIAGWTQGARGGRAFLRQDDKGWFIELCSGASLMLPATLQSLALSPADAASLLAQSKTNEAGLGADYIAAFDSFDGTMLIGRDAQ